MGGFHVLLSDFFGGNLAREHLADVGDTEVVVVFFFLV
jgi:hypothetical protein